MKKIVSLVLAMVLVLCMTACGENKPAVFDDNALQNQSKSRMQEEKTSESISTEITESGQMDNVNILVVYFSRTGTTKPLAEYAAEYLNADIFEIEAAVPYTDEDMAYLRRR